jgi:predicted heme/steroid binding protein
MGEQPEKTDADHDAKVEQDEGAAPEKTKDSATNSGSFSIVSVMVVVAAVAYVALTNASANGNTGGSDEVMITAEELKKHDGDQVGTIWLAVLGEVYDVTEGKQYYGKGEGYAGFAGKDGTAAFVTGEFNEKGLTSDVSDFTPEQMMGVNHWKEFYHNSTKYFKVGLLVGRHFGAGGKPTADRLKAIEKIQAGANLEKEKEERKKANPSCNMKWSQDNGGEVWCPDETMLPRKVQEGAGKRCACFTPLEVAGRDDLEGYDGCGPRDAKCITPA